MVNSLIFTCSKKAVIRNLKEFFKDADKDENGTLTLDELTSALKLQGYKGTQKEIAVSDSSLIVQLYNSPFASYLAWVILLFSTGDLAIGDLAI